jgi:hypothetical protein
MFFFEWELRKIEMKIKRAEKINDFRKELQESPSYRLHTMFIITLWQYGKYEDTYYDDARDEYRIYTLRYGKEEQEYLEKFLIAKHIML